MSALSTYPLIQIPAAILTAFRRIIHALVCLEMPIQMSGLFLLPFAICGETSPTCSAAVGFLFVETRNKVWSGTGSVLLATVEFEQSQAENLHSNRR